MHISNFFNAAIGIFLLAGCSSTYYYSDFINPSEVYIPSKIYAVGLLNRGADSNLTAAIFTDGIPYAEVAGLPKRVSEKTIDQLDTDITKLNRFKFVPINWDEELRDERDFMEKPLSSSEIDSLCDAYQVDGIVALEGVEFVIRTDGDVNVVTAIDDAGMPVRVPEFSSNQKASYTVAWRFYDGLKLEVADLYQETYERYFNRVAYNPAEASEINPQDMQLLDIAREAADDYEKRISPHWENGYRLYYRGNTTALSKISQTLEYNRDWEVAAAKWTKLTTSEDTNEKYYAMYNMAVASEMLGRPRVAKEWLEKAIAVKDSKQASKYMETIKKQILIYDVVDQQLGLDN